MNQNYRRGILAVAVAWVTFQFTFLPVSAAGTQIAEDPAKVAVEDVSGGGMHVHVSEGMLSIEVREGVSLSQILRAIAVQAGFRLSIRGSLGDAQPQTFTRVPLRKGIELLVGNHNLVMINDPSTRRPTNVRVYEVSHRKQAAIEPRPPPPPPDFWMWSRRLRQDSRMKSF